MSGIISIKREPVQCPLDLTTDYRRSVNMDPSPLNEQFNHWTGLLQLSVSRCCAAMCL